MDLSKVLFLGGKENSGSVQIRGRQIAQRLGCACQLGASKAEQICEGYEIFVCANQFICGAELAKLAQRGTIVWDILDRLPPRENISVYLVSTRLAQSLFRDYGRVVMIPHHHCNFNGKPNPTVNRRPGWIGTGQWYPEIPGVEHDRHFVDGSYFETVVKAYQQTGIGLNLRAHKRWHDFHIAINSGVKLINCIGFGIPSISGNEPAFREVGESCTIFSTPKGCAKWVRALQNDDDLYMEYRKKCLRKAKTYHIDTIAAKYRKLLESL